MMLVGRPGYEWGEGAGCLPVVTVVERKVSQLYVNCKSLNYLIVNTRTVKP